MPPSYRLLSFALGKILYFQFFLWLHVKKSIHIYFPRVHLAKPFDEFRIPNILSRLFSLFQKQQIIAIEEFKLSKKNRVGIIPFVHNFEVNLFFKSHTVLRWTAVPTSAFLHKPSIGDLSRDLANQKIWNFNIKKIFNQGLIVDSLNSDSSHTGNWTKYL